MKKICYLLLIFLLTLVGCNNDEPTKPATYKISIKEGNYEIKNLADEALEGETVYFDVSADNIFYEIDKVYANDEEVKEGGLGYSFVMPASDVQISCTVNELDEYNDANDRLEWGSSVDFKIYLPADLTDLYDKTYEIPLSFIGISSGNYMTILKSEIKSKNEDIIPSDAITIKKQTASTSNSIIGASLIVDLTKVKIGETMLYVKLDSGNSSLKIGTLRAKFSVVPESEYQAETMDVTFKIENNSDVTNGIFINITDNITDELTTIHVDDLENNTYNFKYIVGHTYHISCASATYNEEEGKYENMISLDLNEWQGTNIGGAINKLEREGNLYYLTLTTPNINVSLIIIDKIN